MPVIVIVLNIILIRIATWGVKWIGYESKSIEESKIQSAVFFSIFVNEGISILLINANFFGTQVENKWYWFLLDG